MFRSYSLFTRRRRAAKECQRILNSFHEWQAVQRQLPEPSPAKGKLLVIRLDDIGDYLLFRNQLGVYKKSPRWKDHSVTLLGNTSWKDIFEACDKDSVDDVIWVNKSRYLIDAAYRLETWQHLRARGFDTVVAPSRTRPLLLDDLCMLAAAPLHTLRLRQHLCASELESGLGSFVSAALSRPPTSPSTNSISMVNSPSGSAVSGTKGTARE